MTLVLRPAAIADVRAAREYHEDAGSGLHEAFARELDLLFARLEAFPRSGRVVADYEPVRRTILRRFPYAVFYRLVEPDQIHVLRIIHTARSPDTWPA